MPTPTIVEAARRVESLIDRARAQGEQIIIFATSVPGASKTLAAPEHRHVAPRCQTQF